MYTIDQDGNVVKLSTLKDNSVEAKRERLHEGRIIDNELENLIVDKVVNMPKFEGEVVGFPTRVYDDVPDDFKDYIKEEIVKYEKDLALQVRSSCGVYGGKSEELEPMTSSEARKLERDIPVYNWSPEMKLEKMDPKEEFKDYAEKRYGSGLRMSIRVVNDLLEMAKSVGIITDYIGECERYGFVVKYNHKTATGVEVALDSASQYNGRDIHFLVDCLCRLDDES